MVKKQTLNLFAKIAKLVAPPPKLTVSEWADKERVLSQEASAEPGKWNTDRAPYQREILDSVSNPQYEDIIIKASAQVGKSEIINNIIGYFIDYDPAPLLLIMPTDKTAEAYSKDRIAPMIRDTPALSKKVGDPKSRDGNNTLLHKKFPGGHLTLVGANAPSGLASRPIRVVLADEVDRFPVSAGKEGDPLSLGHKRTTTFWNRKKISVSTPTDAETSRIEKEYNSSTKGQWCVSCPSCGVFQPYEWTQIRFENVTMECVSCKMQHKETEWKVRPAKWIHRNPTAKKLGFHLNALASPWERWATIIEKFKEAKEKGTEMLKTWKNTTLGEVWEEKLQEHDHLKLMDRREDYPHSVPDDVLVLTGSVDVQDDRLEIEIVGWGVGEQCWGIEYKIFTGDPGQQAIWDQLDLFLAKEYERSDGVSIIISAICIDSGGHYTSEVYKFCKAREHRRIYAIKGKGGNGVPFISRPSKVGKAKDTLLYVLGVNEAKDTISGRLKIEDKSKPGYCRFPLNKELGYDEAFFVGLTSEYKKIRTINGAVTHQWVKRSSNIRNEPFDLRVYNLAALRIFSPDLEYLAEHNLTGNAYVQTARKKKRRRRGVLSKGV
ncbi:phage terminase large subunit family protein [Lysinibacillus sphaericus]|uniref:phage terminase large subunit family protein n=1 Tax=Lysinibacillus sphaericus TaxID=1421 RepID=UPI0018CF4C90|nr:phage terminase large subunit family protein [Lysinibacillus sphaericus]MBG9479406.1 terminase [Lysinibacillus sphaericus]MBG9479457.1 terminase [Lysinibacillus sphaericus]